MYFDVLFVLLFYLCYICVMKPAQMLPGLLSQTPSAHRLPNALSHAVKQSDPLDHLFYAPASLFQPR